VCVRVVWVCAHTRMGAWVMLRLYLDERGMAS